MLLVKSRAKCLRLRDVGAEGKPMREVGPRLWVEFERLPPNMDPNSDCDFLVLDVKSDADLTAALAENERNTKSDADSIAHQDERRAAKIQKWNAAREKNGVALEQLPGGMPQMVAPEPIDSEDTPAGGKKKHRKG